MIEKKKNDIDFTQFEAIDMRVAEVMSAPMAEKSRFPSRVIALNLGELGSLTSVGQFALIPEEELVGKKVIVCINLGKRKMGKYLSEALVLGVEHPNNNKGQNQAVPFYTTCNAINGSSVY